MPIRAEVNTKRAEKRMMNASVKLCRDSAGHARGVARAEAREDTKEMKLETKAVDVTRGGELQANAAHSAFNEFGTGRHGERPGRQTEWVYLHPRFGFVTTTGMTPQPFMRPGFRAGVGYFHIEARRRGM